MHYSYEPYTIYESFLNQVYFPVSQLILPSNKIVIVFFCHFFKVELFLFSILDFYCILNDLTIFFLSCRQTVEQHQK